MFVRNTDITDPLRTLSGTRWFSSQNCLIRRAWSGLSSRTKILLTGSSFMSVVPSGELSNSKHLKFADCMLGLGRHRPVRHFHGRGAVEAQCRVQSHGIIDRDEIAGEVLRIQFAQELDAMIAERLGNR